VRKSDGRPAKKRVEFRSDLRYPLGMIADWHKCPDVERDARKVSGAWVFKGTRVPVRALFDNIEDGASVDDFLEWFPGVSRHQVESVLEQASASLLVESST
jgi:uncharacterized protein (DUF433 family)